MKLGTKKWILGIVILLVLGVMLSSSAIAQTKFFDKFTSGVKDIKNPKDLDKLTTSQKLVAYPAAFFKVPKLLANTLILAGLLVLIIIFAKITDDRVQKTMLFIIAGILAVTLSWSFAIKTPGIYWWQWEAIKNFVHFKVLVNATVISAGLIFLIGWLLSDKLNTPEAKWGSRVLIVVIALMMATNPFRGGVTWEGEMPKGLGDGKYYYYVWESPTFMELKFTAFGNSNRVDYSYTKKELNQYIKDLKAGKEAVMPSDPIKEGDSRYKLKLYPILRGERLMWFIGASLIFAVLFLTQIKAGGDDKKWIDWTIAIYLAANLVHSTNTGANTIIWAGQAIFILVLGKQMSEKATHAGWKAVWWAVAIMLVLLLSSLVFGAQGVLSIGAAKDKAIETEADKLEKQGIILPEQKATLIEEIKALPDKQLRTITKMGGPAGAEGPIGEAGVAGPSGPPGEQGAAGAAQGNASLPTVPKVMAAGMLGIPGLGSWAWAIFLIFMLPGAAISLVASAARGKSEFGKDAQHLLARAKDNIKNIVKDLLNSSVGQIPVIERACWGYESPEGQIHTAFKKNRILIWTMFNFMKRLQIYFGKKACVAGMTDKNERAHVVGSRNTTQSCEKAVEPKIYKDPIKVKEMLREYRSGVPIDWNAIKVKVESKISDINSGNIGGLTTELNAVFAGKSSIQDEDKDYLTKKVAAAVTRRLSNEELIKAVSTYFFTILDKNKKGEKGWCGHTQEVLDYADKLIRFMDEIIRRTKPKNQIEKAINDEIAPFSQSVTTSTSNLQKDKDNYDDYFAACCAHNFIRTIHLELLDQYNCSNHTYTFARKGAEWKDSSKVTKSIYESNDAIEVDRFGRSLKEKTKQLKDPSQIDVPSKVRDLVTWMKADWEVLIEDMRWGTYHQFSRSVNDYIDAMKYRKDLNDSNVQKIHPITTENPAFDKRALADPGKWTSGSQEKIKFNDVMEEVPKDKIKAPALSTLGLTTYLSEKMRMLIQDEEKRKNTLFMIPADSGVQDAKEVITTLDQKEESK